MVCKESAEEGRNPCVSLMLSKRSALATFQGLTDTGFFAAGLVLNVLWISKSTSSSRPQCRGSLVYRLSFSNLQAQVSKLNNNLLSSHSLLSLRTIHMIVDKYDLIVEDCAPFCIKCAMNKYA